MIDIDRLIQVADKDESVELKIFHNAVIKNLSFYQSNPTKANKANLDAAKEAFESKQKELFNKYFAASDLGIEQDLKFTSLRKAVSALIDSGYEVSRSKMSRDKKNGLIDFNPDGSVDQREVEKYSRLLKKREAALEDNHEKAAIKSDLEIKNLEIKNEKLVFELEKDKGKYIIRSDFEAELAARAVIFEAGFRHLFNVRVREWIAIVGGKVDKTADLLHALNTGLDEQLNAYASTATYQVLFEDAQ